MIALAQRAGTVLAVAAAGHALLNAKRLRTPRAQEAVPASYAVLVPARDEAAQIQDCLRALQGHEVTVLDDESTDSTGELARECGARVIDGRPTPAGWLGKPWACAQLVDEVSAQVETLVFVDADVRVAPGGIAAAVQLLQTSGLDIVCPFPRQLAVTPVERLVQPLLQWTWLALLPIPLAERSTRPSLTAACGQLVAVRRAALERAGGFAAVRDAVLDDVALVRAIKATGGRGGVVDGSSIATCHMYAGWAQLRDGYTKSLWSATGSPAGAAGVIGVLVLGWIVPAVSALRGSRLGLLGYAAGVVSRVVTARRTGARAIPDALAHPVSVAVLGWLIARSVWLRRYGELRWKGRGVTPLSVRPAA